jgi:uncharacterized protein YgbK (DUF1537 family)
MNRITLGCIGDDYTGSSDLANALTRQGLRTIQTIGVPADDLDLPPADAVVVALKSRSIAAGEAVAMARTARAWLKARGVRHIMFKVCSTFDSTDRGNIGPVMDALRDDEGGGLVPVNCAFPENRRTIYFGNLFVGDLPLNESSMKDHPLNPMCDANLMRVLGRQSRNRIGLVPLSDVDQGEAAVTGRIQALAAEGYGAAIIDSVFDRDLGPMGRAALKTSLTVGASGMGIGLARALIEEGVVKPAGASDCNAAPVGGPIAALSGSCSAATLDQVAQAERWAQVLRLDAEALASGPEEALRAIAWAAPRLKDGPVLIASSAPPEAVQALQARFGREAGGRGDLRRGGRQIGARRLLHRPRDRAGRAGVADGRRQGAGHDPGPQVG